MDIPLVERQLFGGAIVADTPHNLIDASDLRQVPDTQEVFLYPDSGVSIIVEILQRVEPDVAYEAARFHFDSLAHDNSAVSTTIDSVTEISNGREDETPPAIVLCGIQHVPKFNRSMPDEVHILMALFRIEKNEIDLVVTFNIPTKEIEREGRDVARAHFDTLIRSLRIIDFGLFE